MSHTKFKKNTVKSLLTIMGPGGNIQSGCVRVCVCVFSFLLRHEDRNRHFTSEVGTC